MFRNIPCPRLPVSGKALGSLFFQGDGVVPFAAAKTRAFSALNSSFLILVTHFKAVEIRRAQAAAGTPASPLKSSALLRMVWHALRSIEPDPGQRCPVQKKKENGVFQVQGH